MTTTKKATKTTKKAKADAAARGTDWACQDAYGEFTRILTEAGAVEDGWGDNFASFQLGRRTFYVFESPPRGHGPFTSHWTELDGNLEVILAGGFTPQSLTAHLGKK